MLQAYVVKVVANEGAGKVAYRDVGALWGRLEEQISTGEGSAS